MRENSLWTQALQEVQGHILFAARLNGFSRPQRNAMLGIYLYCGDQIKNGPPAPSPTNQTLANKYSVSLRTVTNWRREGCPFDAGQVKVLDWLSQRRYAPAGTREKFTGQLAKRDSWPFVNREYQKALDQVRQFKRDCLTHGHEPPDWTRCVRATRRTKGIPTGHKAKRRPNKEKGAKPRGKTNYGLKFLVAASKVSAAD